MEFFGKISSESELDDIGISNVRERVWTIEDETC